MGSTATDAILLSITKMKAVDIRSKIKVSQNVKMKCASNIVIDTTSKTAESDIT